MKKLLASYFWFLVLKFQNFIPKAFGAKFQSLLFSISYLLFSALTFAQQNSPYSRYGLGEIRTTSFPANHSMGLLTSAYRSSTNINFANPASLAAIKFTTFETGVFVSSTTLHAADGSDNIRNANLSHIAFAFPVAKKWGMSFGLIPFSRMDYNIERTDEQVFFTTDTLQVNKRYEGTGSLYQLYFGNAVQIKKFSAGLNIVYFFGKFSRLTQYDYTPDAKFYFDFEKTSLNYYSDLVFNAGSQYTDTFKNGMSFLIGANSRIGKNIGVRSESSVARINIDTVTTDTAGKIFLPSSFGFGFALKKENKWMLGIQGDYTWWSKFKSFEKKDSLLADNITVGIGGEITPDYKSLNYLKNIQYRLGVYGGTNYLKFGSTQLQEFGVTFGFGLPIKRTLSRFNLGFEIGQKGTTANNLLKENFFKVHIGITINDIWFIKRKFD